MYQKSKIIKNPLYKKTWCNYCTTSVASCLACSTIMRVKHVSRVVHPFLRVPNRQIPDRFPTKELGLFKWLNEASQGFFLHS